MATACVSNGIDAPQVVVPDIDFPTFPDPTGWVDYDEESGLVKMPLSYYTRIFEYKVRVDEAAAVYKKTKEIYKQEN